MNTLSQKSIKTLALSNRPTVILTNQLLAQITQAHYFAGKTEWSGLVLYNEKEGSIEDPDKLVIECDYMYPMDIGQETFTESIIKDCIVDLNKDFDGAIEYKHSYIHSHHTMDCFFSGKDTDTLYEQVDKYYYFLSLIVNMSGKYCAKIAMLGTERSGELFTKDNKKFKLNKKADEQVVYIMDCDIKFQPLLYDTGESFEARISKLKALKPAPERFVSSYKQAPFFRDSTPKELPFREWETPARKDWKSEVSAIAIENNRFKSIPAVEYETFMVKWINHDLLVEGILNSSLRKYENLFTVDNFYMPSESRFHIDLMMDSFYDFVKSHFDETYLTNDEKQVVICEIVKVLDGYCATYNFAEELVYALGELEFEIVRYAEQ